MSNNHISGRAYITVNGIRRRSRPGATLRIGGVSRSTVTGDDGVHGYTEAVVGPRIEATFTHTKDFSIKEMDDFKDGSITFETDSGRTFIMNPAWRADDPGTLNSQEGQVPYVFEGVSAEEV